MCTFILHIFFCSLIGRLMIRCYLGPVMIAHPPKHGSSGIARAIVDLHRPPNVPSGISNPMLRLPSAPVAPTRKPIVDLHCPTNVPFANSKPMLRLPSPATIAPTRKTTLKTTLTTILHLTMIGTRANESLIEPLIRYRITSTHADRHSCLGLVHQIRTCLLGRYESVRRIRTQLLYRHLLPVRPIHTRLYMTRMSLVGYHPRTRHPSGITIGPHQRPQVTIVVRLYNPPVDSTPDLTLSLVNTVVINPTAAALQTP